MESEQLNQNCKTCLKLLEEGKNEIESGFVFLSELVQTIEPDKVANILELTFLNEKIDKIIQFVEKNPYKLVIHNQQLALRLREDIKSITVYSLEYYLQKLLGLNRTSDHYYILKIYFMHPQWVTVFSIYDNLN